MRWTQYFAVAVLAGTSVAITSQSHAADPPSIELALSFKPKQNVTAIDTPTKAEYPDCKVQVENVGKTSGWVVTGAQGQVIRRFVDTDADKKVDQWRYYQNGLEVYRDYDTNGNNVVDQSRWLNTGGSRWGIDSDENGTIDGWKRISAEETTMVAVEAMASGNSELLSSLTITKSDLQGLGVIESISKEMLSAVADAKSYAKTIARKSQTLTSETRWVRFDSSMLMPNVVPFDEGKSAKDITVYENVMAIIETGEKTGFVQIGEMIKVGESWKLTQLPSPIEGNSIEISAGGLLMQPVALRGGGGIPGSIDPEMQKLLDELQKLDRNSPSPTANVDVISRYNSERIKILNKLVSAAEGPKEREQWLQQMIDGIATAIQTGGYPDGMKQLESIHQNLKSTSPNSELVPYVSYRRMLSEYGLKIRNPSASDQERQELQEWWLGELEKFATDYPNASDAGDAMLQLAIAREFSGAVDESKKWYTRIARSADPKSDASIRAKGAMKRLELTGKPLVLQGKSLQGQDFDFRAYRGKTVLVLFWSTWCQPCTEDLPQLLQLYAQHKRDGFEILGVNLDTDASLIQPYLQKHRVLWPHIRDAGGLDGELSKSFGIISLPTMFLVDKQGVVISNATSVEDLKERLPKVLR